VKGQNILLEKYDLQACNEDYIQSKIESLKLSNLDVFRKKLTGIEGKFTEKYFNQIFGLLPEKLRSQKRKKFKAYDGVNNAFNLAYTLLKWRAYRAILGAKLEPYLGFIHSEQFGKPSLVCDFMELYRYLIDDFLVEFLGAIGERDFIMKDERTTRKRRDKREYLNNSKTGELVKGLDELFGKRVDVPRIKHGFRQTLETLINEEALLLAKYLRNEIKLWIPRIAQI